MNGILGWPDFATIFVALLTLVGVIITTRFKPPPDPNEVLQETIATLQTENDRVNKVHDRDVAEIARLETELNLCKQNLQTRIDQLQKELDHAYAELGRRESGGSKKNLPPQSETHNNH